MPTFKIAELHKLHGLPVTSANAEIAAALFGEWQSNHSGEVLCADLTGITYSHLGIKTLANAMKETSFVSLKVPLEWVFAVGFKAVPTKEITIGSGAVSVTYDLSAIQLKCDFGVIKISDEEEEEIAPNLKVKTEPAGEEHNDDDLPTDTPLARLCIRESPKTNDDKGDDMHGVDKSPARPW